MDVFLRRLKTEDISQVVEIEREAFSPLWVSTSFKRELNNKYACYLVACPDAETVEAVMAETQASTQRPLWQRLARGVNEVIGRPRKSAAAEEFVAGYVSVWYQGEEAHITEIAVREKLRGRGIGELLLIGSMREAVKYGSKVMTLEVRVSNFIAQRLYEKYAFKTVGTRKGYYSDNREDAVIMTTSPIDTEEYQQLFQGLQETYRSRWGEIQFDG
ncbi:MAG: ribosomal protein S18-alanine N-acetyltransferase [Chloroflexi bacterium]|nr:ribosomal protein S18-alanine N-acetyltransferase [Chloroflexota bacterium]